MLGLHQFCDSQQPRAAFAGATPPQLLLQAGKDGNVYILDRNNLGGIGGQLFVAKASNTVIIDVPAVYALPLYASYTLPLGHIPDPGPRGFRFKRSSACAGDRFIESPLTRLVCLT